MTIEKITQAHEERPFKPFTIHLADGSAVSVRHPEMLARFPGSRTIIVATGPEEHQVIDLLLVTKLTFRYSKSHRNGR